MYTNNLNILKALIYARIYSKLHTTTLPITQQPVTSLLIHQNTRYRHKNKGNAQQYPDKPAKIRSVLSAIQRTRSWLGLFLGVQRPPRDAAHFIAVMEDLFRDQLGTSKYNGNTRTRVGARADKVQILDAAMLCLGPEAEHVEEGVAETEDSATVEVEGGFPRHGRVDSLFDDVGTERDLESLFHRSNDGFTG